LPGKNVRLLDGIPLIVHSINYAKENSSLIDEIIITTDDPEIKNIAEAHGVNVIDRPSSLSNDIATTISALKHVLENIEYSFENVILLQPTNPLRPKKLLQNAYKVYSEGNFDSLITVSPNNQKFGRIIEGRFVPSNYKMGQRSQDINPLYFENGLLYITKAQVLLNNAIIGDFNFPFIVDDIYSRVDIDTLDDFEYAEFLLKKSQK